MITHKDSLNNLFLYAQTDCFVEFLQVSIKLSHQFIFLYTVFKRSQSSDIALQVSYNRRLLFKLFFTDTLSLQIFSTNLGHAVLTDCDSQIKCAIYIAAYFNPRSPCGLRLRFQPNGHMPFSISIHAVLADCDGRSLAV